MDLAQKANRAKKHLQAAVAKPEATSLRHAVESFDAFVDAVVEEIAALKKERASASPAEPSTTAHTFDDAEVAASLEQATEAARATA